MEKYLSILVLTAIIVPSVAFASWWNPFSWFNNWNIFHKTETKTEILENRILELEKKLASSTDLITATNTKKEMASVVETKTKLKETIAPIKPTTSPSTVINTISENIYNKPTVNSFSVNPSTVVEGQKVTFSWLSSNSVSCAVPILNPSALNIPFTGKLPQGTHELTVPISGLSKDIDYYIVCADKDWNTTTSKITLHVKGSSLEGEPHTYYDNQGNKTISISLIGANSGHLICVNSNYNSSNPPKVVDHIVITNNISHEATAPINSSAWPGTPLSCTIEFGTGTSMDSFYSYGVEYDFSVYVP